MNYSDEYLEFLKTQETEENQNDLGFFEPTTVSQESEINLELNFSNENANLQSSTKMKRLRASVHQIIKVWSF